MIPESNRLEWSVSAGAADCSRDTRVARVFVKIPLAIEGTGVRDAWSRGGFNPPPVALALGGPRLLQVGPGLGRTRDRLFNLGLRPDHTLFC